MKTKKILIAGAGGFVGQALKAYLSAKGYDVVSLSRTRRHGEIFLDIENEYINPADISDSFAIISLAGENIFTRWNTSRKQQILDSRVKSARAISKAISLAKNPPKVFLCASALGYYGTKTTDVVKEFSPNGEGFLAKVCAAWEDASRAFPNDFTKIVNARFGVVLDNSGGFLQIVRKFLSVGVCPIFGLGADEMSWISLADLCRGIEWAIKRDDIEGAVNFCEPNFCTYSDFADAVGLLTKFSVSIKIPQWIIKILLGELSDELIFSNIKAMPNKLLQTGFRFNTPNIFSLIKTEKSRQ